MIELLRDQLGSRTVLLNHSSCPFTLLPTHSPDPRTPFTLPTHAGVCHAVSNCGKQAYTLPFGKLRNGKTGGLQDCVNWGISIPQSEAEAEGTCGKNDRWVAVPCPTKPWCTLPRPLQPCHALPCPPLPCLALLSPALLALPCHV